MKFTVSSALLLSRLQMAGKAISSKNKEHILDNFLLQVNGNDLTITASDLEITIKASMEVDNHDGNNITIALPAKLLLDTIKEFDDIPLTFDINDENFAVIIRTDNGVYNFVGQNGVEYPQTPELSEAKFSAVMDMAVLSAGVGKTVFATSNDDKRPVMTGILFDFTPNGVTFVATDGHKLVRLINSTVKTETNASVILPRRSASLLKNMLSDDKEPVTISFDDKNVVFQMSNYTMICRQIEGRYPNYNNVIPSNNPFEIIVDRSIFINAIRRISIFANEATCQVKIVVTEGQMQLSAQDIDFSISAQETLVCQYQGEQISIGFRAPQLIEILSSISNREVRVLLADRTRAGVLLPLENEENEDLLTLLMPVLIHE